MDTSPSPYAVRLQSGQIEFRISGLELRAEPAEAERIGISTLEALGWTTGIESGLRVGDRDTPFENEVRLRDAYERIRASGATDHPVRIHRPRMTGPWDEGTPGAPPGARGPKTRRFGKEAAAKTPPPQKVNGSKRTAPQPVSAPDGVLDVTLFSDPEEQLRYEVRHFYLVTTPEADRKRWPLADYKILPSFVDDVNNHAGQLSKKQILSAIVDVVTGRVYDMNSREAHPLRTGRKSFEPLTRSDGAICMRAAVSSNTPAARRIQWWRTQGNNVELGKLAVHDDMSMPEK